MTYRVLLPKIRRNALISRGFYDILRSFGR